MAKFLAACAHARICGSLRSQLRAMFKDLCVGTRANDYDVPLMVATSMIQAGRSEGVTMRMTVRTIPTLVVAVSLVVSIVLARSFVGAWLSVPAYDTSCDGDAYDKCIASAKTFLDRHYAETKDPCDKIGGLLVTSPQPALATVTTVLSPSLFVDSRPASPCAVHRADDPFERRRR